jgi:hypothetical protein
VWEQVNFTIDSNLEVTISMMVSPDPKDRGLLIEDPSKPRVTRRIEDTDTEALVREVKRRGKR